MTTTIEAPATLTVDGKEYPVSGFSETVQRLVVIHTAWRNDLQTERLAVAKSEAAIRALDAELSQTIAAELKEPESANDPVAPTPAADVQPIKPKKKTAK